ncbi:MULTISPECIES: polyprenyl synthetase family protein [unclassified Marinitoga]|uniref:polyprenyl synthetase family protein n=1 Tax=unclassified Marinitoga TaxID=2640159 RepID=UPI00064132B1|nr:MULTISPECIES: polyprenyl synthetase family protein [unclassified Marinitoga]KLO23935.1 Polyprenyl synthetase [Marinitoga sp. 1155]NUU99163.1 hypothetical protein [Marinitoga sp. 1154]
MDNIMNYQLEVIKIMKKSLKNNLPKPIFESLPKYGKMLRTQLGILMFDKYSFKINKQHIHTFAAIELIHLASLLHDDVIDGAKIRRNKKTINTIFSTETAITVGDIILIIAFQLIESLNLNILREYFLYSLKNMAKAELIEQLNKNKIISKKIYFEIIKGKTGALFGLSASLPSIFKRSFNKKDYKIGETLGILYQIFDDINDFKKTENTGKSTFLDIKNGIISFPIILAFEKDLNNVKFLIENKEWEKLLIFLEENDIINYSKKILFKKIQSFKKQYNWLSEYIDNTFKIN